MRGFFAGSVLAKSKAPSSLIPKCGKCGLCLTCQSPKMKPSGKGRRNILIVGEAPGRNEDEKGEAFVGDAGQVLSSALYKFGVDLRQDCHITNALICRPPKNASPNHDQIDYCRPNLRKALLEFEPEIIIPLGGAAVRSLLGAVWNGDIGEAVTRWVGWQIPCQKINAWICPTYHPSYVMRQDKANDTLVRMFFEKHLKAAVALSGRPWEEKPDYRQQVELISDPAEAARIIRKMVQRGGPAAFDFETTCVKPYWGPPEAAILSASVCWRGKKTIAFPWHGKEIVQAMREFMQSPMPKVASNIKMEDGWGREMLGVEVNNWVHDTTIYAHLLDNREGITGLKFQSFVLLGAESYDDHIKKFRQAKKGERINRMMEEVDLDDLLYYNGLDSLLDFQVAEVQRNKLGLDWSAIS